MSKEETVDGAWTPPFKNEEERRELRIREVRRSLNHWHTCFDHWACECPSAIAHFKRLSALMHKKGRVSDEDLFEWAKLSGEIGSMVGHCPMRSLGDEIRSIIK